MSTITASQEQHVVDQVPKQLYIAGEWRDGAKGTLAVEDPSTGATLCEVADASTADAMAALPAGVAAPAPARPPAGPPTPRPPTRWPRSTRRSLPRPRGRHTRRASGARSSAARSR